MSVLSHKGNATPEVKQGEVTASEGIRLIVMNLLHRLRPSSSLCSKLSLFFPGRQFVHEIHSDTIYNSSKVGTTQILVDQWMDKYNVA